MQLSSEAPAQAEDQVLTQLTTEYVDRLARCPQELLVGEIQLDPDKVIRSFQPLALPGNTSLLASTVYDTREGAMCVTFRLKRDHVELGNFDMQRAMNGKCDLSHRYVHSDERGHGRGSQLLSACEQYAAATDASVLTVSLGQYNLLKWLMRRGYESPEADNTLAKVERGEVIVGARDYMYLADAPAEELYDHRSDWVQRLTVAKRVDGKNLPV